MFLLRFLFILLISINALAGRDALERSSCGSAFEILNETTPDRYSLTDDNFFVSAEVMPTEAGFLGNPVPGRRTLAMNFSLKNKEGRSQLRGKEEFKKVLAHFAGRFDQIRGTWIESQEGELSDNLDQFNKLTSGPGALPPEKAALMTWTGQQAAAAGYTEAVVLRLDGEAGRYTQVVTVFRKP